KLITSAEGFLTGPNGEGNAVTPTTARAFPATDPHRAIKAFLREHAGLFGHGDEALDVAPVLRDYTTAHNGLRTVVWEQRLDDIAVVDGLLTGHITRKGELVSLSSQFLPKLDQAANAGAARRAAQRATPLISATDAVLSAAKEVGEEAAANGVTALDPQPAA